MKRSILIIAAAILLIQGCAKESRDNGDDYIINVLPVTGDTLKADITGGMLNINQLKAGLFPDGVLSDDCKGASPFFSAGSSGTSISSAQLWLGTDDVTPPEICAYNYTCMWNNTEYGVYKINASNIAQVKQLGLTAIGFPSVNGEPKLLGDGMLWVLLKGAQGTSLVSSNPVKDVAISMSVYGYKRDYLKNLLFIRYDIKNTGSRNLNKVYAGFRSDTDVSWAGNNSTGYLSSQAFTYTYIKPGNYRQYEDSTYKQVIGFTFLKSPLENSSVPFGVSSHRIMRKNNYYNPEFGEYNVGLNEAMYTLKGLSNNNTPMIDPMTKQPSMYAFTGDPVSGTGWLDVQVDT